MILYIMSFLSSQSSPNLSFNPRFNTLKVDHVTDLTNSGVINVGALSSVTTINGVPVIPSGNITSNTYALILRQGAVHLPGSNIFGTWSEIISHLNSVYSLLVSDLTIVIYIDSTLSPCLIDQSLDCTRIIFRGESFDTNQTSTMIILDGTTLLNPKFNGPQLNVKCDSKTTPSIQIDNSRGLFLSGGINLMTTATATVSPIQVANGDTIIVASYLGCTLDSSASPGVSIAQLGTLSALFWVILDDVMLLVPPANAISSIDNSSLLLITSDASADSKAISVPLFTGTLITAYNDNAIAVGYDDSKVPVPSIGSNVQAGLDYFKTHSGGVTFPLLGPADSAPAPNYSWSADPSTGMFSNGPGFLDLSVSGAQVAEWTGSGLDMQALNITDVNAILGNNSFVANPLYSFQAEQNSGLYRNGNNDIRLAVAGADVAGFSGSGGNGILTAYQQGIHSTGNAIIDGQVKVNDGARNTPAFTFQAQPNLGMYRNGVDDLRLSGSNTDIISFTPSQVELKQQLWATNGSNIRPAVSWTNDIVSGLYRAGANDYRYALGTVDALQLNNTINGNTLTLLGRSLLAPAQNSAFSKTSAFISVPNVTPTVFNNWNVLTVQGDMTSNGTNIRTPSGGPSANYQINVQLQFDVAVATTYFELVLYIAGVRVVDQISASSVSNTTGVTLSYIGNIPANTAIACEITQNSGGPLNVGTLSSFACQAYFQVYQLG